MDIHFNTGRLYTKQGQIIRAVWDKDNEVIHFADFSRACHGSIVAPSWSVDFKSPGDLAYHVVNCYNRREYKTTAESTTLLMNTGRDENATVHQFKL